MEAFGREGLVSTWCFNGRQISHYMILLHDPEHNQSYLIVSLISPCATSIDVLVHCHRTKHVSLTTACPKEKIESRPTFPNCQVFCSKLRQASAKLSHSQETFRYSLIGSRIYVLAGAVGVDSYMEGLHCRSYRRETSTDGLVM